MAAQGALLGVVEGREGVAHVAHPVAHLVDRVGAVGTGALPPTWLEDVEGALVAGALGVVGGAAVGVVVAVLDDGVEVLVELLLLHGVLSVHHAALQLARRAAERRLVEPQLGQLVAGVEAAGAVTLALQEALAEDLLDLLLLLLAQRLLQLLVLLLHVQVEAVLVAQRVQLGALAAVHGLAIGLQLGHDVGELIQGEGGAVGVAGDLPAGELGQAAGAQRGGGHGGPGGGLDWAFQGALDRQVLVALALAVEGLDHLVGQPVVLELAEGVAPRLAGRFVHH